MKKKCPVSRKDNLVVQEADDEVLIYDLISNKAFCLNKTSALIWDLCDGNRSVAEISDEVGNELKSEANEGLIWLALDQLKKEKLIENEVTMPAQLEGLSRRQIIKQIGLSSMIALPVVAAMIAPTSIYAQSCSAPGPLNRPQATPCTASCQCANLTNPATPQFPGSMNGMCCRSNGPGQTGLMNTCIGPLNTPQVTCFFP